MGNRRHGRNGFLYASVASGGTAEPLFFLKTWSIQFNTDQTDVTAFGDGNKVYVAGLPDGKGSFSGFWSDDSNDMFTAATDGVARKFYLYADKANKPNTYWFGTAFFDFSAGGDVGAAVTVSGNMTAAGTWSRNAA